MDITVIRSRKLEEAAKDSSNKPGVMAAEQFCQNILSALTVGVPTEGLIRKLPEKIKSDKNIGNDLLDSFKEADALQVHQLLDATNLFAITMRFFHAFEKTHFYQFEIGFNLQNGVAVRHARIFLKPKLREIR